MYWRWRDFVFTSPSTTREHDEAARENNVRANTNEGKVLNLEARERELLAQLEQEHENARTGYELLKESRQHAAAATARAEQSERANVSLHAHVETLQASNDRLVQAMMEMRRAGYGLLRDIFETDVQEGAKSVDEEDAAVVETAPDDHRRDEDF